MLELKNSYKNKLQTNNKVEDQIHILLECPALAESRKGQLQNAQPWLNLEKGNYRMPSPD